MKIKEHIGTAFMASAFIGVGISYGKVYAFHIVLVMALAFMFMNRKEIKPISLNSFSTIFPLILFAFFSSSLLWTGDLMNGIKYVVYLFFALSLIYLPSFLIKNTESLIKSLRLIGCLALVEMLIGLLESFSSFRFPISPYSQLIHLFGRKYSIPEGLQLDSIKQLLSTPTGFHWNPNNFATVMVLVLPFFFQCKNRLTKILASFLCSYLIFISNSRTAILALIIVALVSVVNSIELNSKKLLAFLGSGIVILVCILNFTPLGNKVYEKSHHSIASVKALLFEYHLDNNSIGTRQKLMQNAFTEICENNYLGSGVGSSHLAQIKYGKPHSDVTSIHNFWLEILVDGGLVIFLAYAYWYIILIRDLGKHYENSTLKLKKYARACSASLIGCAFMAFSCSSLIYFLPFWLLIGTSLLVLKLQKSSTNTVE